MTPSSTRSSIRNRSRRVSRPSRRSSASGSKGTLSRISPGRLPRAARKMTRIPLGKGNDPLIMPAGSFPAGPGGDDAPWGSVLASFGSPPPARPAKISRLFSARASDAGLRSDELELDAFGLDVVQRLLPAALWPVVAGDSVGRPVLGGIERPEAVVETGGVEGRAQAGLDEAGCVGAVRQ